MVGGDLMYYAIVGSKNVIAVHDDYDMCSKLADDLTGWDHKPGSISPYSIVNEYWIENSRYVCFDCDD